MLCHAGGVHAQGLPPAPVETITLPPPVERTFPVLPAPALPAIPDALPPVVPSARVPAPAEKTLHFTRDPLQAEQPAVPAPPIQLPPVTPPAPAAPLRVAPAAPVVMPTPQPDKGDPKVKDVGPGRPKRDEGDYSIRLELPSLQVVTQLESEAALRERMRNESRKRGERISFPDEPIVSKETYKGRQWAQLVERVEPGFVSHGDLLFEQPNSERYGWGMGVFQPAISTLHFYWDVFTLPYNLARRPFENYDSSAGKCLPGDAVPLLWYPTELSVTGLLAQTGAIVGGFFVFP